MGFIINKIVVIMYLATVCYLAYRGRRVVHTASHYMIAGRKVPAGITALSYGGAFIGTTAIVGFGGAAALFGFSLMWLGFFIILAGILISFVFFGTRTRRMGMALDAHTFPEVLGERYQSRFIQVFAGMMVFAFVPIYAAAILIGIARYLEVALNIPYVMSLAAFSLFLVLYVILRGLKGVMYTDAFHGVFMVVIMAIFCYLTYKLLGGIIPAHQALTDIAAMIPARLAEGGHQGWTTGLRMGTPLWWIASTSIIYGVGIGVLAQPQLVGRVLTASSDRELNRGVLVGGLFVLFMIGVPLVVGPLTNVIFAQRFGEISIAVADGNMDKIIPLYVTKVTPWWFRILFLVGMLALSTAALSSQFRVGAAALVKDIYGKSMGFRRSEEAFAATVGMALTIAATIIWGFVLPPNIIAVAVALVFGVFASSFLPIYFLGLYWKGVTRAGAIASMVGGICASFVWMIFFHYLASAAVVGKVNIVAGLQPTSWIWQLQYVDPIVIALPISYVLCIWVSRKTKKMPREHLNRCFKYING